MLAFYHAVEQHGRKAEVGDTSMASAGRLSDRETITGNREVTR
jgi:hypothetical protein